MKLIRQIQTPLQDQPFMDMVAVYENELHAIDLNSPIGEVQTYLDVDEIETYVSETDGKYDGFIVIENRDDACEIHECYVAPSARNGRIVKALILKAFEANQTVVFNIFLTNDRSIGFAEYYCKKKNYTVNRMPNEVWGVACEYWEVKQ